MKGEIIVINMKYFQVALLIYFNFFIYYEGLECIIELLLKCHWVWFWRTLSAHAQKRCLTLRAPTWRRCKMKHTDGFIYRSLRAFVFLLDTIMKLSPLLFLMPPYIYWKISYRFIFMLHDAFIVVWQLMCQKSLESERHQAMWVPVLSTYLIVV